MERHRSPGQLGQKDRLTSGAAAFHFLFTNTNTHFRIHKHTSMPCVSESLTLPIHGCSRSVSQRIGERDSVDPRGVTDSSDVIRAPDFDAAHYFFFR